VISLLIMGAGGIVEVAWLLGRRSGHAGLLIGAGGIVVGIARPGVLGWLDIAVGVINIVMWLNRRRRDRARRAIGSKERAIIAAMTSRMREAAQSS
jgi:hypothetical protein